MRVPASGAAANALCEFAERGCTVVHDVVPQLLVDRALSEIDQIINRNPPSQDHRGPYFYWRRPSSPDDPLFAALMASAAWQIASSLVSPLVFSCPDQVQVSLNIPVWDHRPGGPHIDGLTPPEPCGRPGTFTLLAGIFLTDQTDIDMGNLWVWPRSHRVMAAHLMQHGPEALLDLAHPKFPLAEPEQILGKPGDLLVAHYLLGHNMGGNTSPSVRRMLYFRLHAEGHRDRWRECVQDVLYEFEPVRAAIAKPSTINRLLK